MKNNKGFSLLELIIIIAIISALVGFGLSKSQVIYGYNAQEAYKKTLSAISSGKVQALSKSKLTSSTINVKTGNSVTASVGTDGVYIEFYKKNNYLYTKTYVRGVPVVADGEQIGGKGVTLTYKLDGGTLTGLEEAEGDGLMLSFDRSTGSFLPSEDGKYVTEIRISGGSREYIITLMPKTGKVVKHGKASAN